MIILNNSNGPHCDALRIKNGFFEHDHIKLGKLGELGEMATSITVKSKESIRWYDHVIAFFFGQQWTRIRVVNEENKLTDVYVNIHDVSSKLKVSHDVVQGWVKTSQVAQKIFNAICQDNPACITAVSSNSDSLSSSSDSQGPCAYITALSSSSDSQDPFADITAVSSNSDSLSSSSDSQDPFADITAVSSSSDSLSSSSDSMGVHEPLLAASPNPGIKGSLQLPQSPQQRTVRLALPEAQLEQKVERLKQMWSHETDNTDKLRNLCQDIEDNKDAWQRELSLTDATIIKKVTSIRKKKGWVNGRPANLKNYSVYIVKGNKPGTFKTFINLGKTHKLGQGCFKQAFEALDFDSLKTKALTKGSWADPKNQKKSQKLFQVEKKAMQMFPNQKTLLQTHYVEEIGKKQYMIMSLCELGELKKYESKYNVRLAETDMNQITLDVLEGMQIMHEQNVVHQDIKPANILLYKDKSKQIHAKVADFGFTISLEGKLGMLGSKLYYSPEKFMAATSQPSLDSTLGKGADVFALGLTLYAMYFGVADPENRGERLHPFDDLYRQYFGSNTQLLAKEIERRYADKLNDQDTILKKVIWGMLNPDKGNRITIAQALGDLKNAWEVSSL